MKEDGKPSTKPAPQKDDAELAVLDLLKGISVELQAIPDCDAKTSIKQHLDSLNALLG